MLNVPSCLRHREVRMVEHAHIRVHPPMHVALEWNHHVGFFLLEYVLRLHSLNRLRGVEFRDWSSASRGCYAASDRC